VHGFTCVEQPAWVGVKKSGGGGNRNFKRLETKAGKMRQREQEDAIGYCQFLS